MFAKCVTSSIPTTFFLLCLIVSSCANTFSHQAKLVALPQIERKIWLAVNKWRQAHQRLPLRWNIALAQLARSYSVDMAYRNFFSHTDPDGRNIQERFEAAGLSFAKKGENLARINSPTVVVEKLLPFWLASPKHLQNLQARQFHETGIGVAYTAPGAYYITQIFAATH